jgi:hypothetical protein
MTNNNSATALTDLAGFPMVLAVSEDEINRKFAEIYGNASNGPETFPHMPWKALKGKGWELDVDAVSAPHIDFKTNTKNGCVLRMTIQSGQFTTFKMVMPDTDGMPDPADIKVVPTTIPLDGLELTVTATISKIENKEWSDKDFSAQALFMDMTTIKAVEVTVGNNLQFDISGTTKASLETLLHDKIKALAVEHPNQLLFGAARLPRNVKETTGPLAATASGFSTTVNSDEDGNQKGAVNFLLCNKSMPDIRHSNGAGVFDHCLLHGDDKATLVISDATILEHFVKPALMSNWVGVDLSLERHGTGSVPSKLGFIGSFDFGVTLDGHDRSATLKKLVATIKNDLITVDYNWTSSVYHWSADIHVEVSGTQTIQLVMQNGKLTAIPKADKPHIATTDTNLAARIAGDIFSIGIDEIGRLGTSMKGKKSMHSIHDDILSHITPSLGNFILPGKSVLQYVSAHLDRHLYVSATYK